MYIKKYWYNYIGGTDDSVLLPLMPPCTLAPSTV